MTATNHADRAHSIYSPSAYSRWSRCPGSAKLTADLPREDSEASLRGTYLHEVTEAILRNNPYDTGNKYHVAGNLVDVQYVVTVVKNLIDENTVLMDPIVSYEERVTLAGFGFPEVFGTSDLSLYNEDERHMYVVDYKFGHGEVEAEGNGQLMIYAAGRFNQIDEEFDFPPLKVTIMIIQPALPRDRVKKHEMSAATLLRWMNTECAVNIELAMEDDADVNPGPEQCKWCQLSGTCPAQKQQAIDIMDSCTEPGESIPTKVPTDQDDIAALLPQLVLVEQWIEGVRKKALGTLRDGGSLPGYKLVKSVTKRKWADPEKAEKWLAARKIPKDQRTETKIISITKAEALLKDILKDNPRLQTNFSKLLTRPEGKHVMALDSDKREAIEVYNPLMDDSLEI